MMTGADLLVKDKDGDLRTFEELVSEYENKIYTLCYRYMGNEEDAYDMAQEAFIKAFRALKSFQGKSSFSTWLYRVAANVCLDELRRRQRRISAISIDEPVADADVSREFIDNGPGVTEIYEQKELSAYIQEILNKMKPIHKSVIIMRDIMELSYEEIAEVLNCSTGTVKSRLSRARTIFRNNFIKRELLP
jgi:RNA polymerase sigma-70 factor (ECF subfamily)